MSDASDEVIRVLIVDDHKVVQRGLLGFLKTEPDIEVVGDAQDGRKALEILSQLDAGGRRPDVVLMDLQMPVMDGVASDARDPVAIRRRRGRRSHVLRRGGTRARRTRSRRVGLPPQGR